MIWKDRDLKTIGDLAWGIEQCATREEAQAFMELYRAESPNADKNVGYMSGYYGAEEAQRIRAWFGVEHPIFGTESPTPREALLAGMAIGGGADEETVRAAFGVAGEGEPVTHALGRLSPRTAGREHARKMAGL